MLRKQRVGSQLLDKLHKGFVVTCMAVTVAGLGVAGYRAYMFFTVTKPAREAEQLKKLQLEKLNKEELTG